MMEENILIAQANSNNIIVGGDYNSNLNNHDNTKMKFLLTDLSMQAATDSQLLQATYVRGTPNKKSYVATRPDHILHYGIIPQACHVYDHTAFINDHKPLVASFIVRNQIRPHYSVLKSVKRVTYDPNNNKQRIPFEQFLKEA